MPPIGSALAGRIRRCGAWLTGPDFCLSRCVGGTGIWETAPPAALGGKFGTYGDLISLLLWSADGRASVLYHVILPLPQAIWMQEYRKAGAMDSGMPVHIHYQPGEAHRFSRLVLWSSFVKTMRQLCQAVLLPNERLPGSASRWGTLAPLNKHFPSPGPMSRCAVCIAPDTGISQLTKGANV